MPNPALLQRALLGAALMFTALCAAAQTSVKVGGFRTITMLSIEHGVKQGHFKREGLDVEIVTVNAGPAVISALASDSVQIGYAASVPVLFARAQNQPVRIFDALTFESGRKDDQWTWLIASARSGVTSARELQGKTVAINAGGGACELLLRDHLAKAGVAYDSVKKIVVPFPQMQAALQLGNADAVCVVEPFRTNINVSPAIKGAAVARGILAEQSQRYALDVLFVREDWGRANADVLKRFNRGLAQALADYRKDPTLLRKQMIEDFKLGPATVSLMKSDIEFEVLQIKPAEVKPLLDGLTRHGMLKANLKPEDFILQLQ